MPTTTPNLLLKKPTVGADADEWGTLLNESLDTLDAKTLDKTTGGTVNGPLTVTGNATLGDAGTDTTTLNSQLSANGTVGTSGQVLSSRGANLSPQWINLSANSISQGDSSASITDTGANGTFSVLLDGVARETTTATAKTLAVPLLATAGTAASPSLTTTGDTDTGVFFPAANTLALGTAGAERARVTSGGNLLVGTTVDVAGHRAVISGGDLQVNGVRVGLGGGAVGSNTSAGRDALFANTTGAGNSALGFEALRFNTAGGSNTAVGFQAAFLNTTGGNNTAVGYQAGYNNTTGTESTLVGHSAGLNLTTASGTAFGFASALRMIGGGNIAVGNRALLGSATPADNTGAHNVVLGNEAGTSMTSGGFNVLIGSRSALQAAGAGGSITTGTQNVAVGPAAMRFTTTGANNVAVGTEAGYLITTGSKNSIIGGYSGNQGNLDIRTASNYIVLSDGDGNPRTYYDGVNNAWVWQTAGTERARINSSGLFKASPSGVYLPTNGNNADLTYAVMHEFRNQGLRDVAVFETNDAGNLSNVISQKPSGAVGFHFAGIVGTTFTYRVLANGNVQNTNNSYGAISDLKLKENITDATPKLASLNQLRVVNYNLKGDTLKQIGLIAQEVEQVFPGLVESTPDIDPETKEPTGTVTKAVKYSVLVPMLLKAVQELTAEVNALKAQVQGA